LTAWPLNGTAKASLKQAAYVKSGRQWQFPFGNWTAMAGLSIALAETVHCDG